MILYTNQPVRIEREQTKYPFDQASTLKLDMYRLSQKWIDSFVMQISKATFPIRLAELQTEMDEVILTFKDYKDIPQAVCNLKESQIESDLFDLSGIWCGRFRHQPELFNFFYNLVKNNYSGYVELDKNAFILSSTCIRCCHFQNYRTLDVNGLKFIGEVVFNFKRNIAVSMEEDSDSSAPDSCRIDVYGNLPPAKAGIQTLQVLEEIQPDMMPSSSIFTINEKDYWIKEQCDVKDKYLIIRPDVGYNHNHIWYASDLRVVTNPEEIIFQGTRDVSRT